MVEARREAEHLATACSLVCPQGWRGENKQQGLEVERRTGMAVSPVLVMGKRQIPVRKNKRISVYFEHQRHQSTSQIQVGQ